MLLKTRTRASKDRGGAVLVESAIIYGFFFTVLLAVMLLGLAVFRYQEVAHMAREGARYASTHGGQYASENSATAPTADTIYTNAILPHAVGMESGSITYSVAWYTSAAGVVNKNPTRTTTVTDSSTGLSKVTKVSNTVSVTVTYTWNTGFFGTIPVSSTSVNTIAY